MSDISRDQLFELAQQRGGLFGRNVEAEDFDCNEAVAGRIVRAVCASKDDATFERSFDAYPWYGTTPFDKELQAAFKAEAAASGEGRLIALPTYTAMLELRALLTRRGVTTGSFA